MKLKAVELYGFKSFAERSKLVFEKDISAIVGPNGSGKSNISDAIRWVLGEQSAKSLRGSNMQDVIFSGTETKKQMNMASVSLTLDNRDKTLDIGFDELTVTRKVFRTGESEYLINNSPVRLKDIKELFMDTGIGKDGYSIIGQGRIDDILSGRSEDRRFIFEEASGIAKYKYKKNLSEKKLEKNDESLERLKNELKVKKQEVALLEGQATNAREGVKLTNQLERMELSLLKLNIDRYDDEKLKLEANSKYLEEENEEKKSLYEEISSRISPINDTISSKAERIEGLKSGIIAAEKGISSKEAEISILKEKIKHFTSDIERLEKDISERNESHLTNEKKLQETQDRLKDLKEKRNSLDEKILAETRMLESFRKELAAKEQGLISQRNDLEGIKEKISRLIIDRSAREKMEETNLVKRDELIKSIKADENDLEESLSTKKSLEEEIKNIDEKMEERSKVLTDLLDQRKDLISRQKESVSSLDSFRNDYYKIKSQRDVLYSIYTSYEGYYKPIQRLLQAKDKNPEIRDRIVGVLADLIEVEKSYKQAIDVCLGPALQNIVVEDEQDAKYLIDYIKRKKFGRITFLPISKIKGTDSKVSHPLVIDSLNHLIKYDDKISSIINHFLSRTLLVANMDDAIKVSNELRGFRLVTLDGEIINSWGSMVGGDFYKKDSNSLLNRQKELKDLKSKLSTLAEDGHKTKSMLEEIERSLEYINTELNEIDIENNKLSTNRASLNSRIKELNIRINFIQERIEDNSRQIKLMTLDKDDLDYSIITDLEKDRDGLLEKVDREDKDLKNLQDMIQDKDKDLIRYEAEFKSLVDEIQRLEDSQEDLSYSLDQLIALNRRDQDLDKTRKEEIREASKAIERLQLEIEKSNDRKEKNKLVLEEEIKDHRDLVQKVKDDNIRLDQLKDQLQELDKRLFQDGIKLDNLIKKREEAIQNYMDTYDTEFDILEMKLANLEPIKVSKKDVLTVKNKLSKIGFFNFASIEEYNVEKENLDFIQAQFDDLVQTKEDILKMIKKLESDMTRIFNESFKKIDEKFKEVFQVLFDGGEAQLLLDGPDVLTAGIEIIARPPGKKLKNIGLLSGGEKALTAVALLIAIFEINPAPFCLLDEIDAALDEANIKRYIDYLKTISDKTQFIIITHRKVTMERAEILYGVTMEEKGVSKVITLALDEYRGNNV